MRISLEIVLPIFAMILCGYVFARARVMSAEGIKGLSAFVFYLAIPALLFRSMAAGVPSEGMNFDVVYVYYLGAMIMFATAMMVGRFAFGLDLAKQSLLAMNATFSNAVLLGIPLIFTAFGTAGQVAVLLIASMHSLVLFTLATVLIEVGLGAGREPGKVAGATALAVARNPFMIAVAVGSVWGYAGLDVPVPLDTFTRLLAGAAAPAALFALGATLAEFRLGGDMRDVAVIVVLKMLVHPALVWVLATQLFHLGPIDTAVVVIVAALPTGANPFILAQRYDIYVQRSASSVVITTALSVLSAALLLAWYAQAP